MKPARLAPALLASVLLSACNAVTPRADLVGTAVPVSAATRAVELSAGTRYVNVVGGDVLRFDAGERAFAWNFDVSPTVSVFALNQIAPPGMLDREVLVYVLPDPRYVETGDFAQPGQRRNRSRPR